jgi:hypothetical protein
VKNRYRELTAAVKVREERASDIEHANAYGIGACTPAERRARLSTIERNRRRATIARLAMRRKAMP